MIINPAKPTTAQVKGAIGVLLAVSETVRTLGRVASGELYALLNAKGVSLEAYESIIRTLKNTGLISESGHELRWTGPQFESAEVAR